MARLIALDPGQSGSAAMFENDNLLRVLSFPHTPRYWLELYQWCLTIGADICVEERVGGWAGQGGKSQFTFGWHAGAPHAVIDVCGIPIEKVEPQWWQRRIGVPHFYDAKSRDAARRKSKAWQKQFCLARWPWLSAFDCVQTKSDGGRERPDIWQSVCIGYAKALDYQNIPLGELSS